MRRYIRPMPATWWLKRKPYLLFMLREFSSVFVAAYAVWLLFLLRRLQEGPAAYEAFLDGLRSPAAILFHIVALAFALLHTITWFNLTPKAMAVRRGEERVPDHLIILPNYIAWVVVSAALAWIIIRS
jgi:fumarate reductase subunit C